MSLTSELFRPLRLIAGPLHHGRKGLPNDLEEREENLPRLPPPWDSDARWYPADFPPRGHNQVRVLPHGEEYFTDLCRELRKATERVTIAAWCITPLMSIERENARLTILAELLREVSERATVYILVWSGAPALFQPETKMVESARRTLLDIAPKVMCELDRTAAFSHDHHQKAVTIDGRVAYVGGMDLSTFQGDRWDTAKHPIRAGLGWHDVQAKLEGETVVDVETNFCQRWNEAVGDDIEPLDSRIEDGWNTPAQVLRTIPKGFYPRTMPQGHFGIRHALLRTIAEARQYIYLENQYLWAPEVVDALCDVMDRRAGDKFRIVVVLPARAYDGRYDNDDHVQELEKHDRGRGIFSAYTLYGSGPAQSASGYRYVPIYVHAKITIVDDSRLIVGSANLNRRGLAGDSEIAVQLQDPSEATRVRLDLWSEHLGVPVEELKKSSSQQLIDTLWKDRAIELRHRHQQNSPPPHWHVHPYEVKGNPIGRLMDHFQSLTLEH